MPDDIKVGAFSGTTVSDRKYQSGQGYEMTRTVKVHPFGPPVHTLRIIVRRGNSDAWASAKVERWDGQQWHEVVKLAPDEVRVEQAPSYVCWDYPDRQVNGRPACEQWLNNAGDLALARAVEVL